MAADRTADPTDLMIIPASDPCHICATYRRLPRLLAVTHGLRTCPTSTYVSPAHAQAGVPTFQAGHEGSIPFARSNQKPQVNAGARPTDLSHQEAFRFRAHTCPIGPWLCPSAWPVTAHLSLAGDLARRADGKRRARLSAAVAEIAGLAAWLHADLVEKFGLFRNWGVVRSPMRQQLCGRSWRRWRPLAPRDGAPRSPAAPR